MTATESQGVVDIPSRHSVDATLQKLTASLEAKGVKVFALVDHSGEAAQVGMAMRPTKLLIFGNPRAGTPLMQAAPRSALDLPLKLLVWEDAQGKVWISYNSLAYLAERHALPQALLANVAVIEKLAAEGGA
jgi:uncharacterized protein (DUF302 family)